MNKRLLTRFTALLAASALLVSQYPASAAGVTVSLNDNSGTADAGAGGQTEIDTSFVTSGFYVTGTTLSLTISPAATSTISHCGTPDFLFTATHTLTAATSSWTSSEASYTFNESVPTGTGGTVCLSYGLVTTPANYSVAILTTSSTTAFNTTDFGAALYYVAGGNQIIDVSAQVPATLSFVIRNTADTAATNICQLGVLSLSQVSFCSYRLRIATNAANGFTTTIQQDEEFNSTGNATMTAITNDTAFATGTEAYGIAFLEGATTGGRSIAGDFDEPVTEAGTSTDASLTFSNDSTPLNFSRATTIISHARPFATASAPSLTTTSLVVHGAAIDAGTPTGNYSHIITYRVTGTF